MAGYSKTPLYRKLGYKDGYNVILSAVPEGYLHLIDLPFPVNIIKKPDTGVAHFIHAFCRSLSDLEKAIATNKPALRKDGMFWISWPKRTSGIKTDIDENRIRDCALANGLVDIKVAAFDKTWSALKLVYRLKDR